MPKLSIIVPTRERSDTLVHTIRTLVNQDYEDCEIIISDNASQDNTREVVESFSDCRIRYVNTGRRVSMSDNWEFALGIASGEFVTYIGDDDGFIPGAITRAIHLLEEARMSALAWEKASYFWPDHPVKGMANQLSLRAGSSYLFVAESRKRLEKLLQFRDGYAYVRLPGLYHGIAKRSLIEKVRGYSRDGVFFESISPDVFSAIAIGMVSHRYLLAEYSFSVGGYSRHSTGGSYMMGKASDPNSSAGKFMSEISREYDCRIQNGPTIECTVMGEYLHARQLLRGSNSPDPPWDRYVYALLRRAKGSPCSDAILQAASHTVKMVGLKVKLPDRIESNGISRPTSGMQGDIFNFKAPVEIVSNIYDACQLVAGMIQAPGKAHARASFSRFARNMTGCFISEAKSLYRSL